MTSLPENSESLIDPKEKGRLTLQGKLLVAMPFDLEVEEEKRTNYLSPCGCTRVFRVLSESIIWLREQGLLRRRVIIPYVCYCCGEIIDEN